MHLTVVIGTTIRVSKNDQLRVLVIPFFSLALHVFDEKVHML
jgi:hypothetical protein